MQICARQPRRACVLLLCAVGACAPDAPSPATDGPAQGDTASTAAAPPAPDIVLAELSGSGTTLTLSNPRNVTDRPGYDNQPAFTPDGRFLLYTQGEANGRTDVLRLDLTTGAREPVAPTPEQSEYSALVPPDGSGVVVVRVEPDSTQRLWRTAVADEHVVLPAVAPVGYHAWVDERHVALFVLGDPVTLVLADPTTGATRVVDQRIGRSLQRVPGQRTVSYTAVPDSVAWIRGLDVDTGQTRPIVPALEGSEDHTWTPDGVVLMGQGSRLCARDPGEPQGSWTQIADLSALGSRISRIAVDPQGTRIAVVLEPAPAS